MKPGNIICLTSTIEELKTGDMAAFERLYLAFEPKLYAFALHLVRHKEDAEEVVQEVFLKVWERREQLDSDQNFDGYLFSIAKNIVYNKARHKVYEFAFREYITATTTSTGCVTEETVVHNDLEKLLATICQALPPIRRQVFVMSRDEGKSNSEIAQLLNTSNSNIENHLYKALRVIKSKLKGYITY